MMDAELQHAIAHFGRNSPNLMLILDPYHKDAFEIGEFVFGKPAQEIIDLECAKAVETNNLDRLVALMGKPFGALTAIHADSVVGMDRWLDEIGRFLMTKKRTVDMIAITQRPEVKEMTDRIMEQAKARDRFLDKVIGRKNRGK